MDNKMKGALVALVGSLCMGGAQLMDMESRVTALEEAHPELAQEELDAIAEELHSEEDPVEQSSEEPVEEGASAESSEE